MKSINQTRNLNNLPAQQVMAQINNITRSFRSARPGDRARMLQTLAAEIDLAQCAAVKKWLVRFHQTFQSMEVTR